MSWKPILIVLCACYALTTAQIGGPRPRVNVPALGMMEGQNARSTTKNERFYEFRAIPYAKPPIGALRYKTPVPNDPWKGVLDAASWGQGCPQVGIEATLAKGRKPTYWQRVHAYITANQSQELTRPANQLKASKGPEDKSLRDVEDCLCLNVYTRSLKDTKYPVMIFYHGGSFSFGSAQGYNADNFMDHELVVIVPNYRLGPLGFMSMQNDEIPGNAGMLDMIEVIKWAKKYVTHFGGDPDQITVFGESSGAASVSLLALSPLSRGLIKGIIAESGAAFAEWAFDRDPLYNARGIAKALGCDMTNDDTITQCFMDKPGQEVVDAYLDGWRGPEQAAGRSGFGGACPTFQTTGDIFLDRHPVEVWKDPEFVPVPAIYGANKHEGSFIVSEAWDAFVQENGLENDLNFLKFDIMRMVYGALNVIDTAALVTDSAEFEYIGYDRLGNGTAMAPGLIDFSGAAALKGPGYESLKLHAAKGDKPSFLYAYNFENGRVTNIACSGFIDPSMPFPGGVCHAAEIVMLFNVNGAWLVLNQAEREQSKKMVKMWYNFAKYQDPTTEENPIEGLNVTWPAYELERDEYLRFAESIYVHSDYKQEYTIAKDEDFGLKNK